MAIEESLIEQLNADADDTMNDGSPVPAVTEGDQSGEPASNNAVNELNVNRNSNETSVIDGSIGNPNTNTGRVSNTVAQTRSNNDGASSRPVCKFFLRQSCKHGRMGASCKFEHPKLCFKFIKHGDKKSGCKNGSQCQYVHPKLCNSYKGGVCSREKCNFYHISGTKFESFDSSLGQAKHSPPTHSDNFVPTKNRSRSAFRREVADDDTSRPNTNARNLNQIQRSPNPDHNNPHLIYPQFDTRDFLEMKLQMKLIQEQIQMLLPIRPQVIDRALPRTAMWGNPQQTQ